jgi:hypothetical protein
MLSGPFTVILVKKAVGVAPLMDQPANANPGYGNAFRICLLFAGTKRETDDQ